MRPMIVPGLRWAWRTPDTVQFGIDVPAPVLLTGLPAFTHQLLPLLDGSRTNDALLPALCADRPPDTQPPTSDAVHAVLERLVHFELVVDGGSWPGGRGLRPEGLARLLPDHRVASSTPRFRSDPAARLDQLAGTRVVVEGLSRLGAVLWSALTASGVARVDARDPRPVAPEDVCVGGFTPAEIGRRRCELPSLREQWSTRAAPRYASTVVHVLTDAVDVEARSRHLVATGRPHLVVTCRELIGRVGPLTVPGRTPCAHCVTLARRDRDPGWAHVWRQLDAPPSPDADSLLVGVTANVAAAHLLDWLTEGTPSTLSGQLELSAADGATRLLPAAPHPECGCAWPDLVA